jgi:amidase
VSELAALDATAQAELVSSGQASPGELVDAAIERIERTNPELNAVITPLFEKARAAAANELPDGPFRGVPMLLKDLLCHSAGDPMYEGMRFLKELGWVEQEDQHLTRLFRRAGLVFLGKTNTPELGILPTTEPEAHGATRNPWDTGHSTGGSSGGSAAAVAAGMVPLAHANDGGGSIRIPASECGLVGLKPSRGRVSLGPDFGDVMTGLVSELAVTRSVRDTAALLDAFLEPAPGEPYAAPTPDRPYTEEAGANPGRLRIGVMTEAPAEGVETAAPCRAAAEEAGRLLESLGHGVDASQPAGLEDPEYVPRFLVRWTSGVAWNLDYWSRRTGREIGPDDVEPCTWALAEQGRGHTAADYLAAVEYAQLATRRLAEWWAGGFDLLLTPTCSEPPPPLGSFEAPPDQPLFPIVRAVPLAVFTALCNTTGQPAISLPLGESDEGLPIGVQLVAPYGREDLLIRVAAQLEEAAPWAGRRPAVFAG